MFKRVFPILFIFLLFLFFSPKSISFAQIVINEFLPNPPSGFPEWVEFYNTTNATIDLSDYYFDDDTNFDSDSGSSVRIALSGLLSSLQTCFLELSSYLNNNGDSPTLFDTGSSTVDTYTYSSSSAGLSYARVPDGGSWIGLQQPTKPSNKCIDLAPTSTPTPTATPTPTNAPTTTKTPTPSLTPTKPPTPTKTPTHTKVPTTSVGSKNIEESRDLTPAFSPNSTLEEKVDKENEEAKTLGAGSTRISNLLVIVGIVLLIAASATLLVKTYKKQKQEGGDEI